MRPRGSLERLELSRITVERLTGVASMNCEKVREVLLPGVLWEVGRAASRDGRWSGWGNMSAVTDGGSARSGSQGIADPWRSGHM
jgi:hypothetical protein